MMYKIVWAAIGIIIIATLIFYWYMEINESYDIGLSHFNVNPTLSRTDRWWIDYLLK